jgi:hypothetical protein
MPIGINKTLYPTAPLLAIGSDDKTVRFVGDCGADSSSLSLRILFFLLSKQTSSLPLPFQFSLHFPPSAFDHPPQPSPPASQPQNLHRAVLGRAAICVALLPPSIAMFPEVLRAQALDCSRRGLPASLSLLPLLTALHLRASPIT